MAATDDDKIVQEIIWLIAERKGHVSTIIDMETRQQTRTMDVSRNWIIEALRALKPVVESVRPSDQP